MRVLRSAAAFLSVAPGRTVDYVLSVGTMGQEVNRSLGGSVVMDFGDRLGLVGPDGMPRFWLGQAKRSGS